ncbi:MAG: hypothetical protein P4L33_15825 [Capsulimonadaceae bacterium]|nr:hypothetical protein [Capsulimonadaceae bacterium]
METIDFEGWKDCIRLANGALELVAFTKAGPRIVSLSSPGGANLFGLLDEFKGKIGPSNEWTIYGGHRLWHAPEYKPRSYQPDNDPVGVREEDGDLVLTEATEAATGIQKEMAIRLAGDNTPAVQVEHRLTNRGTWAVELAPWALSVVAPGGRVIFPQAPHKDHGEDNDYLPARPLVMWPFTDMADPRWTWGTNYIQLRSDASRDFAQKLGVYSPDAWAAFEAPSGDLLVIFIDLDPFGPEVHADMGSNFETFTKGAFQELESLGPLVNLGPDETVTHIETWVVLKNPGLPKDDAALAAKLPALIEQAAKIAEEAFEA